MGLVNVDDNKLQEKTENVYHVTHRHRKGISLHLHMFCILF